MRPSDTGALLCTSALVVCARQSNLAIRGVRPKTGGVKRIELVDLDLVQRLCLCALQALSAMK